MESMMRLAIAMAARSASSGGRPVGVAIAKPMGEPLAACPDGVTGGAASRAATGNGAAAAASAAGSGCGAAGTGGAACWRVTGLGGGHSPCGGPCLGRGGEAACLRDGRLGEEARLGEAGRAEEEAKPHPLRHAIMVGVATVARAQVERRRCAAGGKRGAGEAESGPGRCLDGPDQYLCNGCDVFVTVEPCPMCAMALVHSRIRRLVYALPAPGGACGSAYRVHTIPSINHHYQVVRGLLRDEAAEALGLTGPAASDLKPG
ncbi:hypothetical protein EMIHUDRAFT_456525 [Emiliania huxleyi CCMP1516]|uniref:CMP/dCMP-type deaminase domain-containing protein n=2 Tax=Emiliania huxleyi TaxID=2903 RepID=A0A0D3K443_EMIH1|nr:hypothetical protein EMIHUDRAFT_456525 [Emiliania huxleyi CCMP1516]EOD30528.1 hypothetical protein EMIHUDRAFT_456525 [Emiliania huxleyi CCMP1516]|eukprot:XP_005782957.1 hypothetical protein EMIHUDRAFT_456525 [Emiliania huxleyi CCMP1516]